MIVLRLGTSIAILVVMQWYQRLPASGSELMAWVAPSLVVAIVYFGVSEGLWSASPGKLLVGLRVIEAGSQPLGMADRSLVPCCGCWRCRQGWSARS